MEAFQERMVNEYKELSNKVIKLEDFISNNKLFDKLDKEERFLQIQQLTGMKVYLRALIGRLDHQGLSDYMALEPTVQLLIEHLKMNYKKAEDLFVLLI